MAVKPIPDGYHTITPYITVEDAGEVIEFLKKAFDAQETFAMRDEHGKVRHGEVKVGTSMVMLGSSPDQSKTRPGNFYVYVEGVDAVYKKAVAAGGKPVSEPETQFYGDRHGAVADSQGNTWWIATHVEDVPEEELGRRAKEAAAKQTAAAEKSK